MSEGWSDAAIPDLRGRRAIVTGGNSGIGVWTALQLAAHGARVVIAARSLERGALAMREIRSYVPRAEVEAAPLDLADLGSVRTFAEREQVASPVIDILVNNAGVALTPRGTTKDGFETQFGTNHLGHFALTGLLLPQLLAAPAPRVVTVSSDATRRARLRFDDVMGEHHYDRWAAYAQSKLANLLFIRELGRRAEAAERSLTAAAAHPGFAATGLASGFGAPSWTSNLATRTLRLIAAPPGRGALPTLYAATMPVPNGSYWGPGSRGQGAAPEAFPAAALDDEAPGRLWALSEELTGVTFAGLD